MIAENKDIREVHSIHEIVDCLQTETYGQHPLNLIQYIESLPHDYFHDYLRALSVPFLFHAFEKIVPSAENPILLFSENLQKLHLWIKELSINDSLKNLMNEGFETADTRFDLEVKHHTGQHYGNLFKEFDHKSYFEEAHDLLNTRLIRNNINLSNLHNQTMLDQGCGGGRYTVAWKLFGAKHCTGIDFSDIGIEDAKKRVELAGIKNVDYIKGSVLDMPFSDESFDIVYSNGVLHHTENWQKGIEEQLRVLKKGGWGWQYLIEAPGGIFWDKIEILRAIMKNVNKTFAQKILASLNIPTNRIFYMLDHVMVPINTRLSADEIYQALEKNGAINIKRLARGTDFDRVESIYRNIPFAKEKFGDGENRFVFSK